MKMKLGNSIFKTFFLSLSIVANTSFAFAQTAAILPPAKTTFSDQNGKPLTSGTVDFYVPGTTTRKTTWQDSAETVPNANPVVLDSAGRAIVLGDGAYRQIVKDRNGNLIWDQVTSSVGGGGGGGSSTIGDGLSVGSILSWSGLIPPSNYQLAYGQALSRITFSSLLSAISIQTAVTCVGGSPTLTNIADTSSFSVGTKVEASCLLSAGTIISKTSNSVTLGSNANISLNVTATFFPYGDGDGTTTFNVPDLRGYVLAGRTNMGGVTSSNLSTNFSLNGNNTPAALYALGGNQATTLDVSNLPPHTHTSPTLTDPGHSHTYQTLGAPTRQDGTQVVSVVTSTVAATTSTNTTGITLSADTGTNASGTSVPFSRVQPTATINYIIKVTPDASAASSNVVNSIGGMFGVLTCGAGISCSGNSISSSIGARGTSGYALTGNGGSVDASYQGFVGYTATTPRTWQSKAQDVFSVMDYAADNGCVANATADCSAAFNAAVTAAFNFVSSGSAAEKSATVYVPTQQNCYKINSPIIMLRGVSLKGDGWGSCILANDTDAITFSYVTGYGQVSIKNLSILGANSTAARTAIKRIGTTTLGNIMYGLSVENVSVYNFDTAVYTLTAQNIWMTNNWFQNINQCMSFNGFTAVVKIQGVQCILASGGGTGAVTNDGIGFYPFTYLVSGVISPEGIEIQQTQSFGFATAIHMVSGGFLAISNSDVSASVDGIRGDSVFGGLYVNNNYIALVGSAGAHGIYMPGSASNADMSNNFYSNTFIATGTTSASGIQINDSGLSDKTKTVIANNLFDNFTSHDIMVYKPNGVIVSGNWARSSTTTDSINMDTVSGAAGGVNLVTGNIAAKSIVALAADITGGAVRFADNSVTGVGSQASTWNMTTNSTTANRIMLGAGAGSQPTALGAGTTTTVLHGNAGGAPTFGAVALGTDVSGTLPIANGGTNSTVLPAVFNAAPANPTATASTTSLMMGLGATCAITTTTRTRVRFVITGQLNNTTAGDGAKYQMSYGTGAAPANTAAASGIVFGTGPVTYNAIAGGANSSAPFTATGIATGLSTSTAYWFDIQLGAVVGGTASITNLGCSAEEL